MITWICTSEFNNVKKRAMGSVAPQKAIDIITHLTMNEELKQASKIVNRSKEAITSMFNEARIGKVVNVESAVSLVAEITSSVMRNPVALIGQAQDQRRLHLYAIAVYALMVSLARQLDLSNEQTHESGLASLLHDVGKMAIPLEILNKPGKLTHADYCSSLFRGLEKDYGA